MADLMIILFWLFVWVGQFALYGMGAYVLIRLATDHSADEI